MSCGIFRDVAGSPDIRHFHDPSHRVCRRKGADGCDRRLGRDDHVAAAVKIFLPEIFPLGFSPPLRVCPSAFGLGEFPEVPDGYTVTQGVVPDETAGGVGQGIGIVRPHAVGVAAGPPGKGSFEIIGPETRCGPLVSVCAQNAAAVGVVEEHEFPHHLMLVGSHLFPE